VVAVANGVVYFTTPYNMEFAFNANGCNGQLTCQRLWNYNLSGTASPPVVVNGMLYFTQPGAESGDSVWAFQLP
jgi:outer membrane protein assembly factor BamB